jgi:hypothetical protein
MSPPIDLKATWHGSPRSISGDNLPIVERGVVLLGDFEARFGVREFVSVAPQNESEVFWVAFLTRFDLQSRISSWSMTVL